MKPLVIAALCALPLAAQTMVEHAALTGAAAAGSTGMQGVGKAAAGVMSKAAQVLDKAQQTVITLPAPAKPDARLNLAVPDRARIKPGMDAAQLERDFGSPAMKTTGEKSETWWYGAGPDALGIEVLNGKVVAVPPPPRKEAEKAEKTEPGVVILR